MAQQIVATSQVTLVDLNDAKQLLSFLSATQPKIQVYDPNASTYSPDWTATSNVITPSLYVAGTATNIIANADSVTWALNGVNINPASPPTGYAVGATSPWSLTINQNVLSSQNTIQITCTILWTDTNYGTQISSLNEIDFSKATNGTTAITAVLSNEAISITTASDGTGGNFTGAVSTMTVFWGTTDDSANWTYSVNAVNITGTSSGSPANRTYTVTGFGAGQTTGYVDITATKGANTVTKRFTVSASKSGNDSTSYWLNLSAAAIQIQKNNNNAYNPTTLTMTAYKQVGSGSPVSYTGRFKVEESTDGGTTWGAAKYTSASDESTHVYTPTAQATSAINQIRISLYQSGGTSNLLDQQITPLVADGINAVTAVLTNESQGLAANSAGTVASFTSAVTTMHVYVGSTDDSANWTYGAVVTNCTGSFGVSPNQNTYTLATMTADSATVVITATKGATSISKTFSLYKTYNSYAYWLVSDTQVIRMNGQSKAYTPTLINLTAKYQTGSTAVANYSGRFTVEEYVSSWTTKYTSSVDEATHAYTPTAQATSAITQIRISLYAAGGTVTLLDQFVIPIITDGANSVYAVCWTPNGNTIRNKSGNVTAECDIYSGGVIQATGVTYQWAQLITGTWTNLTSAVTGYNGQTLTITPSLVTGTSSFKCTATYGGQSYYDVVTISDLTDPIVVTITSDTGTVFKNGVGTKNVTAHVYQNGTEIDTLGNAYAYYWSLTDQSGNPTTWVDYTVANPTTALTFIDASTGGTIPASTIYYYRYTWITPSGETQPNATQSHATPASGTSTNTVKVTIPAFPPGVTAASIYVGTASGSEKLISTINASAGNYTLTAAPAGSVAFPASNTASATHKTGKTVAVTQDLVTNLATLQLTLETLS